MSEKLSDRDVRVLRYLARGLRTKETARALRCAPRTVEYCVASIKRKLGVQTTTAAVATAQNRRLI